MICVVNSTLALHLSSMIANWSFEYYWRQVQMQILLSFSFELHDSFAFELQSLKACYFNSLMLSSSILGNIWSFTKTFIIPLLMISTMVWCLTTSSNLYSSCCSRLTMLSIIIISVASRFVTLAPIIHSLLAVALSQRREIPFLSQSSSNYLQPGKLCATDSMHNSKVIPNYNYILEKN